MSGLPFVQVDAFADRPFAGNPAAIVPLDAWLPDAVMQAIAGENNLSETAFTVPSAAPGADYDLRWFTPTTEVAMCGHATLASGHVLIAGDAVRFATRKAGILTVRRDGAGLVLDLPAIAMRRSDHADLLAALGVGQAEVHLSEDGAQATAIVVLDDEAAVRALVPDMKALAAVQLMAIATAPGARTDIASRVFVPAWGVEEDPVTGSAHAALTPFWAARLGTDRLTAHQASRRGGELDCRLAGDRVELSGRCVTVIEGRLFI